MWKKFYLLIIIILLSNEVVDGKNGNNTKSIKNIHKKSIKKIVKVNNERVKRSLGEIEKSFFAVGHELEEEKSHDIATYASGGNVRDVNNADLKNEPPFWGTRGRRDGSSESNEYINMKKDEDKNKKCKSCVKQFEDFFSNKIREELDPFWFERGMKSPAKMSEFTPFWGNRGRRSKATWEIQDEDPPFWGNRGRRDEAEPFWGNRGRRDEMEPFWGNRGRRQETEPFWGTRGRRQAKNYLTKNYGGIEENDFRATDGTDSYRGNQERKKAALKEHITKAMQNVEYGIENLARMRRTAGNSFWNNRGRESTLEKIFKEPSRNRNPISSDRFWLNKFDNIPAEKKTILDGRVFAEQPHFILIERSGRSSAEDDPFFISRGKKYISSKIPTEIRDRRGVLEELVKSVRNDPYYIARGKKDLEYIKIGNSTILKDQFIKARELICSAVDLLVIKNNGRKVKRDANETERDRRTILKKLAAQLQMDPYFVTRGKRDEDTDANEERLEEFINHISNMCHKSVGK